MAYGLAVQITGFCGQMQIACGGCPGFLVAAQDSLLSQQVAIFLLQPIAKTHRLSVGNVALISAKRISATNHVRPLE